MPLRPPPHARLLLRGSALLCQALLCRALLAVLGMIAGAGVLPAAELTKPPVPDPYGLGERLALIDCLQQAFKAAPAQGATLEELTALYWQLSARAQLAARSSDELLAGDRIARLRRELTDAFAIDAPAATTEEGLVRLLAEARQKAGDQALQEVLARAQAHTRDQGGKGDLAQQADDTAARARQGRFGAEARAKQEELDEVQGTAGAWLAELQALRQRISGLIASQQAGRQEALAAEDAGTRASAAAGADGAATLGPHSTAKQALAEATAALKT